MAIKGAFVLAGLLLMVASFGAPGPIANRLGMFGIGLGIVLAAVFVGPLIETIGNAQQGKRDARRRDSAARLSELPAGSREAAKARQALGQDYWNDFVSARYIENKNDLESLRKALIETRWVICHCPGHSKKAEKSLVSYSKKVSKMVSESEAVVRDPTAWSTLSQEDARSFLDGIRAIQRLLEPVNSNSVPVDN